MKPLSKIPQPGSGEAIEAGCRCVVWDNTHGAGCGFFGEDGAPLFWINEDCPLHGMKSNGRKYQQK